MCRNPTLLVKLAALTLGLLAVLGPVHPAAGASVALAWDPSPDPSVVGYAVYFGAASGNYSGRIDVQSRTTATLTNLPASATSFFVVTAYTADGVESLPSNEISYTPPPPARCVQVSGQNLSQLRFLVYAGETVSVQVSDDLVTWAPLYELKSPITKFVQIVDPSAVMAVPRFYRVVGSYSSSRTVQLSRLSASPLAKLSFVAPPWNYASVQASQDLLNWTTLYQLTVSTNQSIEVIDPASATLPQRYYRLAPVN